MPSKSSKNKSYSRGIWAEYWVVMILWLQFYRILEIRYKTRVGEVDVIARRGKSLVFIEVKYRSNFDKGIEAISPKAKMRIRRAAQHYMMVHGLESFKLNIEMQCDVVVVNKYFLIKRIRNAF